MSAQVEELPGDAAPKPVRRGLGREITLGRSKSKTTPPPTNPKAVASVGLIIGAEPTVSLLPPEVHAVARARATRNVVFFALVGVIALVGLAIAGSSVLATNAQTHATLKQQELQGVLLQQGRYASVLTVERQVTVAQQAQRAAASQQIDWKAFFGEVIAALPKGVTVGGLTGVVGSSGSTGQPQSTDALGTASAATVTIQISGASPDAIAASLDALKAVPGFVSAEPSGISGQGATYSTTITLGVSSAAFSTRFETAGK